MGAAGRSEGVGGGGLGARVSGLSAEARRAKAEATPGEVPHIALLMRVTAPVLDPLTPFLRIRSKFPLAESRERV